MKTTTSYNMLTSDEIKNMIDGLEWMNDDDVREAYGFDTVEEANEVLSEWLEIVVEEEDNY